jgi:hypothetical protein
MIRKVRTKDHQLAVATWPFQFSVAIDDLDFLTNEQLVLVVSIVITLATKLLHVIY